MKRISKNSGYGLLTILFVFLLISIAAALPPEPPEPPEPKVPKDGGNNGGNGGNVNNGPSPNWLNAAAIALGIGVILVALAYAVGMAFSLNELMAVAKEELFQVLAVGVMLAVFIGSNNLLNSISVIFADNTSPTLQGAALNSLNSILKDDTNLLGVVANYDLESSKEAAKSSQCNLIKGGYSVSGCGGFGMLAAPISLAGSSLGFAISEAAAMKRLVELANFLALPLLLPVGIILRTFKITRGAGGLLMAVAISMHVMLPLGVIFNEMLGATFLADPVSAPYKGTIKNVEFSCDPQDTGSFPLTDVKAAFDSDALKNTNEYKAIQSYNDLRANLRKYLYSVIIRSSIGPMLALTLFITSIRSLSSLLGAEVDVTSIARFV